jgi:GNAT superfamily N-acetyltransferase
MPNPCPIANGIGFGIGLGLGFVVGQADAIGGAMDPAPPALIATDLAPGDAAARDFNWAGLTIVRIRRPDHPLFRAAYRRLWDEFGPRGEMEKQPVIEARMGWHPQRPIHDHALLYEMLAIAARGEIVAVRDHTAIVPQVLQTGHSGRVLVHLSHLLIDPHMRGSGLSGWMRAFPIQAARECARLADAGARDDITLVAEMEPPDGVTRGVMMRLRSYERAGFAKIGPQRVRYCQPDFRAPETIDMTSVRPLPLALVIRRLGREGEWSMSGAEVREIVTALYTMFGATMRDDHMAPLWALVDELPGANDCVPLRKPLE